MCATKKMILDLDVGIDDAMALVYALGSEEVELIGITATYGNVLTSQSAKNALALLDMFGYAHVPVYMGDTHALAKDSFEVLDISAFIHGKNGVGEVELPESTRTPENMSGVDFIIEATKKYGKDLVYVPTGALTNLAQAIRTYPQLVEEIGKVVIMGGALTVPGNVKPWVEANICQDPEAADEVFRSGVFATMVGLDVTLQTLLTYEDTQKWRNLGTQAGALMADIVDYYIKAYETTAPYLGGCGLHDPLAVAVAVDDSLVDTLAINMQVDLSGETRGRTIGNPQLLNDPYKSMRVAVGVDTTRFLHEFMERTSRVLKAVN